MAPRVPPLPYRKVARALGRLGFEPVRQSGSHVFFRAADGRTTLVPRHTKRDLDPALVRKIIKDCAVTTEAFLAAT